MKRVIILALKTAIPVSIVDPQYVFFAVNNFFKEVGHESFFDVSIADQFISIIFLLTFPFF